MEDIELHFDFEPGIEYRGGFYSQFVGWKIPLIARRFEYGVAIWDTSNTKKYNKDSAIQYWVFGTN